MQPMIIVRVKQEKKKKKKKSEPDEPLVSSNCSYRYCMVDASLYQCVKILRGSINARALFRSCNQSFVTRIANKSTVGSDYYTGTIMRVFTANYDVR